MADNAKALLAAGLTVVGLVLLSKKATGQPTTGTKSLRLDPISITAV